MRNLLTLLFFCLAAAFIWGCQPSTTPPEEGTSEEETTSTEADVETDVVVEQPPAEFDESTIPTSLTIGDPAPSIWVKKWVTGSSIDGFEQGKIHVVEFWATWCPPCRASMPHISELQEKYADEVKFIGVTKEDEQTVQGFLDGPFNDSEEETWREVIDYALVIDKDTVTSRSYMDAADQKGIPTAFIVGRDGYVEWIGHPMQIEEPIEKIIANEWDREVALAEMRRQQEMKAAQRKLQMAASTGDWDAALDVIDKLLEVDPDEVGFRMTKLQLLAQAKRADEANLLAAELGEQHWEDSRVLNAVAWSVATEFESPDLELALKLADRANELTNNSDGSALDTLARVHYELGDLGQAISWQQKAVDQSPNPSLKQSLDQYLAEQQAAEESAEESEENGSGDDAAEEDTDPADEVMEDEVDDNEGEGTHS